MSFVPNDGIQCQKYLRMHRIGLLIAWAVSINVWEYAAIASAQPDEAANAVAIPVRAPGQGAEEYKKYEVRMRTDERLSVDATEPTAASRNLRAPGDGDGDGDGDVDIDDLTLFMACYSGGGVALPAGCEFADTCTDALCNGQDNDCDGYDWQEMKKKMIASGNTPPNWIPPGVDCYDVIPTLSYIEFGGGSALPPLPQDFFFPGSQPWEGRIPLMQRRWAQQAEAFMLEREEMADLTGGSDSVPVSLRGVVKYEWDFDVASPIIVLNSAGDEKEYAVAVRVTDNNVPAKTCNIVGDGEGMVSSFFDIYIEVSVDCKFYDYVPGLGDYENQPTVAQISESPVTMVSQAPHLWAKKKEAQVRACEEMQDFYAKKADEVELRLIGGGIGGMLGGILLVPLSDQEACCLQDARCVDVPPPQCVTLLGDPQGPGTSCLGTPTTCSPAKWSQPPVPGPATNHFYGWNQYSVWDLEGQGPSQLVADDWVCESTEPVSDLHWWGSYVGWRETTPPPSTLQYPVDHFHVLFWTDIPAGVDAQFSHPGQVIWEVIRPRTDVHEQFVGWDFNPATNTYDAAFHYDLDLQLPEWFYQDPSPGRRVYWVTIAACYEPNPIFPMAHPWGWKTRPRDVNSPAPDAAVTVFNPWWASLGSTYQSGEPICWPGPSPCGLADQWDMAFDLTSKTQVSIFKWDQAPDLQPTGLDVNVTTPHIAADDFECTTTGPLSYITIVGSWYHDILPNNDARNVSFTLSLHSDIPASQNPNGPWSSPGVLLWSRTYAPGDFFVQPLATGLQEGWMEPPDFYDPMGDTVAYTYQFSLLPGEFTQTGTVQNPVIYWLDVQAFPVPGPTPAYFGWKTSATHWNDDATWNTGPEPPATPWQELRYVWWHPYAFQSIDLAFTVVGSGLGSETVKWSQPPETAGDCFRGWNEYSVYGSTQWIVADDWPCETDRPITDIHWWGSYLNWGETVPPPVAPDSFHIGIWTDVPFLPPGFSHPGQMIAEFVVPRSMVDERAVGCDVIDSGVAPETCFKYDYAPDVVLFSQPDAACSVYWVSISAVYGSAPDIPNPWGWKTREHLYMDDAVRIFAPTAPVLWASFDSGEPILGPDGLSWDMAFVLTSPEEKEACCILQVPGLACQDLTLAQCAAQGGSAQGPGTVCTGANEACCLSDGSCIMIDPLCCDEAGGTSLGPGTACVGGPDACCLQGGACLDADPMCCPLLGGLAQGPFTECRATEACCLSDSTCEDIDPNCCDDLGGSPQGPGTACLDVFVGCCLPDGTCTNTDPLCCDELGGTPAAAGTTCLGDVDGNGVDDACEGPTDQACCLPDGTCVEMLHSRCVALGGDPQGPDTNCDLRVCHPIKWAQPPAFNVMAPGAQCFWGWDEQSHYECCQIVADDWACANNQPITDIHWWGSYQYWTDPLPPPIGVGFPDMFHIGIWTDVPAEVDRPFSHPGVMVREWIVPRTILNERHVGCDQYPGMPADACFRYDFEIPEADWFYQNPSVDPTIYWTSISAWYVSGPPQQPFIWGWKTREHVFNDDAVRILAPNMPTPGMSFIDGIPIITPDEQSWDMAFVLTTRRPSGVKWEQWPSQSLPGLHAHDGVILADNWECRGGLVTDFHWWGNYELDAEENEIRGDGINCINVSIHANRPEVPWCLPQDQVLWGVCASFEALNERFTGMYNSEGARIYQYDYYLPGYAQTQGEVYWLNLEAVPINPARPAQWRWQEADRTPVPRLCPAAERTPSQPWHTIVWADDPPEYSEMAFRVTSRPYPPDPDPTGVDKTRFISFVPSSQNGQTAMMVTLTSLHHPIPPYSGGIATDFSAWEGQVRWVGPPQQYLESTSSGVSFWASKLQCEPYYQDWSTPGLLHVTGAEIIPSSYYDVQAVSQVCAGAETGCADVSNALRIRTTRWGDVTDPYNPPSTTVQPDIADIGALVNKFRSAPGAPIKARALLARQVPDMVLDLSFAHISDCVDAFKGVPYPYSGPCLCPSTVFCESVACSPSVPCAVGQVCKDGFCRDACERCTSP